MQAEKSTYLYDPAIGSRLLTGEEAADYLNYHPVSIRRLVSEGSLKPYKKAGKTLLFLQEDLDRFKLTSAWAARKSAVEKPMTPPKEPPGKLEAKITVDMGLGSMFTQPFEPIKNFSWDQIPLVRADIDSKYGNRPFEIAVTSPDGGLWSISYQPPTWLERAWKKLRGQGKEK